MGKLRTSASKFPSKYSPNAWVTGAQYIIELICEQRARFDNKDLSVKFWNLPEWEKFFVSQTRKCNQLLKKYHERVVIKVVKDKKLRTLHPKWVDPIFATAQKEYDAQVELYKKQLEERPKEPQQSIIDVPKRRTARLGTSALDKLLALDEEILNGEEESGEQ